MKNNRQEKGITLIALVITIVVLLILAGVSISLIVGDTSIFDNAEQAVQQNNFAGADEQAQLIATQASIEQYKGTSFTDSINKAITGTNFTVKRNEGEKIIIVDNETGREYEINSVASGGSVGLKQTTLAEVAQPGDYVDYIPGTNFVEITSNDTGHDKGQSFTPYTGAWQVLYNDSTHGLQIISSDIVKTTEGNGYLTLKGQKGYNNLVTVLNKISEFYLNESYADEARSVGSDPSNPVGATTQYSNTESEFAFFTPYNNQMLDASRTYSSDYTQMTNIQTDELDYYGANKNLAQTKSELNYFLASRYIFSSTSPMLLEAGVWFCISQVQGSDGGADWDPWSIWKVLTSGSTKDGTASQGVRPVIKLKNVIVDMSDADRDGKTKATAWKLGS